MGKDDPQEFEYYAADDFKPLLPDGKYLAQCISLNGKYFDKQYDKLFLQFEVISDRDGNHDKETLFMVFHMPKHKRVGTGSRYFKAWCKVHGKSPSRNASMSPKIFLKKNYIVRTRTVRRRFDGEVRNKNECYSVIDEIIEVFKEVLEDESEIA